MIWKTILKIILNNDRRELEKLQKAISRFAKRYRLRSEIGEGLQLAVEELFVNVVCYGFDGSSLHKIKVILRKSGPKITGYIDDDGKIFDPTEYPEPDLRSGIEERKVGGLGIHLARKYFDQWKYERVGQHNILEFEKWLIH